MSDFPPGRFGLATVTRDGDGEVAAVLTEHGVVTLGRLLGPTAPRSVRAVLLDDWTDWCARIATALGSLAPEAWSPLDSVHLAPPLPDPGNLYLAGANYYDHIAEMRAPVPDKATEEVFHFMISSGSLTGTGTDVRRPAGVQRLDWEVELAVVMGRRAYEVSVADALDYVAGYTVANDVSSRDETIRHPIFGVRFLLAKGQATLTPIGPAIVPAQFVPDPGRLALSTRVNGELRQDSNTAQMIWSVQEQISFLSHQAPLFPGDIILTGTPAGTAAAHGAYLADGDVLTTSVQGLGTIVNRVVATPG